MSPCVTYIILYTSYILITRQDASGPQSIRATVSALDFSLRQSMSFSPHLHLPILGALWGVTWGATMCYSPRHLIQHMTHMTSHTWCQLLPSCSPWENRCACWCLERQRERMWKRQCFPTNRATVRQSQGWDQDPLIMSQLQDASSNPVCLTVSDCVWMPSATTAWGKGCSFLTAAKVLISSMKMPSKSFVISPQAPLVAIPLQFPQNDGHVDSHTFYSWTWQYHWLLMLTVTARHCTAFRALTKPKATKVLMTEMIARKTPIEVLPSNTLSAKIASQQKHHETTFETPLHIFRIFISFLIICHPSVLKKTTVSHHFQLSLHGFGQYRPVANQAD